MGQCQNGGETQGLEEHSISLAVWCRPGNAGSCHCQLLPKYGWAASHLYVSAGVDDDSIHLPPILHKPGRRKQ